MLRLLSRPALSLRSLATAFSPATTRAFSIAAGGYGKTLSIARPTIANVQVQNGGVLEQVRGMKVRASVKKMCEGCKVRDCDPSSDSEIEVEASWLDIVPASLEKAERGELEVFCGR